MPLYFSDEATNQLVDRPAKQRGCAKQEAVPMAVQAELDRMVLTTPLRDRVARLWESHKLPPSTGNPIDMAFFDALSGEPGRSLSMHRR